MLDALCPANEVEATEKLMLKARVLPDVFEELVYPIRERVAAMLESGSLRKGPFRDLVRHMNAGELIKAKPPAFGTVKLQDAIAPMLSAGIDYGAPPPVLTSLWKNHAIHNPYCHLIMDPENSACICSPTTLKGILCKPSKAEKNTPMTIFKPSLETSVTMGTTEKKVTFDLPQDATSKTHIKYKKEGLYGPLPGPS